MQENVFYKQVGARLRREREDQNMSREHLAELSDISTKFLYEIENGKKGFSCIVLKRICDALHVTSDYVLEGKGESNNQTRIEYMTEGFTEEEFEYLRKMIEGICGFRKRNSHDEI